ncbi:MAG TPA: cell division protein SepF [Methylomusa anaerophila]|uniref:Cell division protein SepF n=1 Tax=Methylomusa anaerophila TaxID=1930071 RepID=A0A348APK7_9FIRM|nr:cell division protein SepF [Methylomusa anaerophila]BBB93005.1 cell division protein SepF [Methylomusa anaerophila]HML87162.1 cell division protein SepF [Methylomusa anaerophila]
MKFMEKVWGSLGLFESVEGDDQRPKNEESETKAKKNNNVVSLPMPHQQQQSPAAKQVKVMVVEPFSFDDAQHVADFLKNRKPVVVNLENTDVDIAKRMIDFISGTTYALSGSIQKVGNNIFLCAPANVDVAYSSREENMDKAFLPWNKQS